MDEIANCAPMRKKLIALSLGAALCLISVPTAMPCWAAPVGDGSSKTGVAAPVDINHATRAELETVPWIGPIRAGKIIAGRPYRAKNDLVRKKVFSQREYDLVKNKIVARH
jgi:competence protein ComEA